MSDTNVTLRDYIEAHQRAHDVRHADHQATHVREHLAEQQAIKDATTNLEHRLAGLNEFRGQLSDQAKGFATLTAIDRMEVDFNRRLEEAWLEIRRLGSANERQQGALAIARFVGFGGLMTGLGALVYVLMRGSGL